MAAILEAQRAQIAELTNKLKAATEAGMTAEQKQAARMAELEAAEAKAKRYDALIQRRRDDALARLPEGVRAQLAGALEGLDADRALSLIEAAGLAQSTPPGAPPPVERGSPAPSSLPTLRDLEADPSKADNLTLDQLTQVLGASGVQVGGSRPWGR